MKTFTTILIVILTIILLSNNYNVLLSIYSAIFILIFGYGVYKLLEYYEDDNRQ